MHNFFPVTAPFENSRPRIASPKVEVLELPLCPLHFYHQRVFLRFMKIRRVLSFEFFLRRCVG